MPLFHLSPQPGDKNAFQHRYFKCSKDVDFPDSLFSKHPRFGREFGKGPLANPTCTGNHNPVSFYQLRKNGPKDKGFNTTVMLTGAHCSECETDAEDLMESNSSCPTPFPGHDLFKEGAFIELGNDEESEYLKLNPLKRGS